MTSRRLLLSLLLTPLPLPATAQQRKSLKDPMRLGAEQALVDSGLAASFQRSFGRDTGVAVQLVPGTSTALLAALEQGELDAAMTNAPVAELRLEKQGLAHDRRLIAVSDFVLVGPLEGAGKKARDPAGVRGGNDIATALSQLAQAQARFVTAGDGGGAHLAEQALWRDAKVAPAAPWYLTAPRGTPLPAYARAQSAYALVERGLWLAQGGKPLAVLVEGDPRMAAEVHVMRSFRSSHPAAKLFGQWVAGPQGRRVAGNVRGWRAPPR
jgi:tungstate transport system substrate-binding protein